MKWKERNIANPPLLVGGRCPELLGFLLTPLIHVCQHTGKRIVLRSTRQQIERYWHLIENDE